MNRIINRVFIFLFVLGLPLVYAAGDSSQSTSANEPVKALSITAKRSVSTSGATSVQGKWTNWSKIKELFK
jgi:hypothetical protein